MRIRERAEEDVPAVEAFLAERHSAVVARLGELEHPLHHPALIVETPDGALAGVLTYVVRGEECEILTLHAADRRAGAGTALIEAVEESRKRLKPEIPETGEYGIPLRDELVLEKEVSGWRP